MRYSIKPSPRGLEVLALAAQGHSKAGIGKRLYVTEDTVKTHLRRMATAYGTSGSTQTTVIAAMAKGDLVWCPVEKTIVVAAPEALMAA